MTRTTSYTCDLCDNDALTADEVVGFRLGHDSHFEPASEAPGHFCVQCRDQLHNIFAETVEITHGVPPDAVRAVAAKLQQQAGAAFYDHDITEDARGRVVQSFETAAELVSLLLNHTGQFALDGMPQANASPVGG